MPWEETLVVAMTQRAGEMSAQPVSQFCAPMCAKLFPRSRAYRMAATLLSACQVLVLAKLCEHLVVNRMAATVPQALGTAPGQRKASPAPMMPKLWMGLLLQFVFRTMELASGLWSAHF